MSAESVRVYDLYTEQLTTIPARELAAGMILAEIDGIDGQVYVNAKQLRDVALRHPPFRPERRKQLKYIRSALLDVHPMTMEEWEEGFRRDANPDREIASWLHIAGVYRHFTQGRVLSVEQKTDIFKLIGTCATTSRDQAHFIANPVTLSKQRVREIVSFFFMDSNEN
jgi:hypothetical protein